MNPEIKDNITRHILDTSKKIDTIFAKYEKDNHDMHIKDLEDLKRYAEILQYLTIALGQNLY